MEEELPEGLVSTNDAATDGIGKVDCVGVEDVQKFWKAASASNTFLSDNIGRRLENYFWRILRCTHILQRLSGSQIAAHIRAIQEGGYIRTTPRGSPRSSRSLGEYYTTSYGSASAHTAISTSLTPPAAAAAPASPLEHSDDDRGVPTPTPSSPFVQIAEDDERAREKRRSSLGRPPPILKKSSTSSSGGSSKNASSKSPVLGGSELTAGPNETRTHETLEKSPEIESQKSGSSTGSPRPRRYVSTRFSEEVAVSTPQPPKPSSRGAGEKSGKRNHVVGAGTGSSKRRSIAMRRQTSQTSSSGKSSPSSPVIGPLQPTEEGQESYETTSPAMEPELRTRTRSKSPHLGGGKLLASLKPSEDGDASEDAKDGGEKENVAAPLVDPDFRSQFADRTRPQHRSFTNLSTAAWRSTPAAPTAASYQASGFMAPRDSFSSAGRGAGKAAFKHEIIPLKAPASAGPEGQDESETATPLPRTKSQLTLLLERNRAAAEDQTDQGLERS